MKANLVSAFLMMAAMLCFFACAILYAISGHWLLAALYMVATSCDGINAFLHFRMWWQMRQLMKESNV